MANEVKLTFAGDADSLERAAKRAGDATDDMARKVDKASDTFKDAGAGFDAAAEGFDKAEQRAMGFRDTLTGVQDGMKGVGGLLKGDFSADNFLALGAGVGDLASGFANFLIPSLKNAVTWFNSTKVGMLAQAAAAKIVTAGQWLLNAAMSANPIGLVVIAIVALIAIFVVLWNKCGWFRDFWKGLWEDIKSIASGVWEWLKGLPTSLKNAFAGLVNIILWPYKTAFNLIADAWNNTVGKLQWTVPSWIPGLGGHTVGAPKLPHFHSGGVVPGMPGQEVLAVLQAGERVIPAGGSGGGATTLQVNANDSETGRFIATMLQRYVSSNGGNVQVVLGR